MEYIRFSPQVFIITAVSAFVLIPMFGHLIATARRKRQLVTAFYRRVADDRSKIGPN